MQTIEEMNKRFNKGFVSQADFLKRMQEDAKAEKPVITKIRTKNGFKEIRDWNIPAAFDIETTQYKEHKVAYMYIWMLNVNGVSTYGRTWEEFESVMKEMRKIFNVSDANRFNIYIHNENFEMSFMMPRYADKITGYFALDTHKPVKVDFNGFVFKDSLVLSAKSLAGTGEDLTIFKIEKMVGDLDYSKKRNSLTPLTDKEMGYCLNDVRVLTAYIWEQMHQYGDDITAIPMTNTGRVREYTREHCLYKTAKSGNRVRNKKFCEYIKGKTLTPELYAFAKQAFMGGFTHAGHFNSGEVLKHVSSMDFTSSYPAVILSEKFPSETPTEVKYNGWPDYYKDVEAGMGVLFAVEMLDIDDGKFPYEHYISMSRAVEIGYAKSGSKKSINIQNTELDNGRIVRSDRIVMVLTEQDWDIITKTYNIGFAKILKAYHFHKDYFPKEMLECMLTLYEDKTTLKDVEGKEAEYRIKKGMANSFYGMMVQDVVNGDVCWTNENGWSYLAATQEQVGKQVDKYNKSGKRFNYYLDGVYITAYARHNLFEGILELKGDYAYSDTDSVKYINAEKHEKFFKDYNERITKKIAACLTSRGLDPKRACPKTVKGVEKPLGVWDYEGYYDEFKTLGAKRYLINRFHNPDGSIHKEHMLTVAGLNKNTGCRYIFQHDDPFGYFDDKMVIPGTAEDEDGEEYSPSGRLVSYYSDEPYGGIVIDEYGNAEMMEEYGGCCLVESDYSLEMSEDYVNYLIESPDRIKVKAKTDSAVIRACR